ncbi:hypothetical protein FRC09_003517, partial [Ceratobasidium sp. 395]
MSGQESSQPEAGPSTPRIPPRLPPSNAQAGPSTSKGKTSKRKRAGGCYSVSAAEATDALSRRVNAEKCWEVAKMPGIMTCGELDQWGLAIASDWNLLACTLCSKADRLVDFTKVREHVKFHFPQLSPSTTTRQIKDVCRKYGALDKAPAEIETPRHGGAPLEMLQRYQLWKCTVCEDQEIDTYTASDRSKRRHHSEVHGNQDPDHDCVNRVVWAQTFYGEKAENKKWFEVDPGALHIPKIDIDHAFKSSPDREATAEEMLRAYNALWTPLQHAPVQVDELRDVMPLLHVTGVAQHAGNRTLDLRPLVQKDGPSNTGYQWIYNAAYDQWIEDQPRITDVPDWEKRALLDDESGKASSMFVPLAPDTSPNYGDLWGRWCMFICYLRDLAKNGNDPYVVPMTTEQKRWADQALLYCAGNNEHQYHAKDILYNLSAAFWRPTHAGYFDSLAKDKFSDPTVRFACLINIRESGEFSSPSNMCHELVRMKYIMRQVLYFWSEQDHEIAGRPMTGIVDAISHALSRRRVSPFAVICSWAAHAASYTHTTVALPSVSWTSDTSLSVHGYQISVPHLGDAIAAEVRALDKIINENLLLGLPPEELGFNVTESTPIVDDLGDTAVDYSMFKDKNLDLEKRLYQAFSVYPQADHLINRIGINDDPARVFKYAGCAKWLETVNLVNRKILLLLHLTGGQSGR